MTARSEILSRLRKGKPEVVELSPRLRRYADPVKQFTQALEAAGGEAIYASSRAEAVDRLHKLLADLQAERVAAHRVPLFDNIDIAESFPDQTWTFPGEVGDFRSQCAQADVGITGAEYALAETGSLVLTSGEDRSRLTSLLPPVHVVLLPGSRILPSIFEWAGMRPDPMPANLVLVSGPSKTADIEQTLIVGVHGPKRLVVVIYGKNSDE